MRNYNQDYYGENKEEINSKNYQYKKERMKHDKKFRIKQDIGKRLRASFTHYSKTGKKRMTSKQYGVDTEEIAEYLYKHKNCPKDLLKNRSKYHIDHIIPLSWFDFNNLQEIEWAFAPENHQCLTAE